jgi:hypothetical protein
MKRSFIGNDASRVALAIAFLAGAGVAHADLVLLGQVDMQATGLGEPHTLLTIHNPASTMNESGWVGLNGGGEPIFIGNITQALSHTRTIAQSGATTASNLRLVVNAQEPQVPEVSDITLDSLVITIYSPTGATLFTSGRLANGPLSLLNTQSGAASVGYVFGLNPAQAAQAQVLAFSGASFASNVIGLSATASNATGGPETFFVSNVGALPPLVGPIPEPGTMVLLASGLLAIGGAARRRKNR